jgi:hypothetical protein
MVKILLITGVFGYDDPYILIMKIARYTNMLRNCRFECVIKIAVCDVFFGRGNFFTAGDVAVFVVLIFGPGHL